MKRLDVISNYAEEEKPLTEEEKQEVLREQAEDILQGIIAASNQIAEERKEVTIARNGISYFKLTLRPLSEEEAKKLRRQCTTYKKNKTYGVRMPDETDMTKYRSLLIYTATVNKEETWDNQKLWKALESRYPIVTGWQTIDLVLLAGEKDRIVDELNLLSGYVEDEEDEGLEETVKN